MIVIMHIKKDCIDIYKESIDTFGLTEEFKVNAINKDYGVVVLKDNNKYNELESYFNKIEKVAKALIRESYKEVNNNINRRMPMYVDYRDGLVMPSSPLLSSNSSIEDSISDSIIQERLVGKLARDMDNRIARFVDVHTHSVYNNGSSFLNSEENGPDVNETCFSDKIASMITNIRNKMEGR